ncbi:glycosyltransferase family 4 protein [Thermotoga caldifontis]|uniref:glycosyltransferase family 4 protein n=1 Tax=Thermotoga caldifontis TaxID=1508419 RepID=UPI001E371B88|nr:glycosyltransferase family 4 protein [Thermotoga caldifontis]
MHVHIGPYSEKWAYHENLLPKYHKRLGHEVTCITSTLALSETGRIIVEPEKTFVNSEGVKVIRLPLSKFLPAKVAYRLGLIDGLGDVLRAERPDLIYVHGAGRLSNLELVRYLRECVKSHGKPILLVDNHADEFNSARNWLSRLIHKTLWRFVVKQLDTYATEFYAVNEACKNFLTKYYRVPSDRIEVLPMGGDPDWFSPQKRASVRRALEIDDEDFVMITGGKIDANKKTIELMQIVSKLPFDRVRLIVFGSIHESVRNKFNELLERNKERIRFIGWLSPRDMYDHFVAADLGVFPGTQSVVWNHAIFCGLPLVLRRWPGMVDFTLGGKYLSCLLIDDVFELESVLRRIITDSELYAKMKEDARKVRDFFSYEYIAMKTIEKVHPKSQF